MKHVGIQTDEYGATFDYRPYFEYLHSVRDLMPVRLFEFAAKLENYDLESRNSLHDAWLEHWSESTDAGSRRQVDVRFLGPYHDRYIHLSYRGVTSYALPEPKGEVRPPESGYGDVLVHEVTVVREGIYAHEILFASDATFSIEFADMSHRVEMIDH